MIKSYIDKAIKYKMVSHFWFHPSMDNWYLKEVFPKILEYIHGKKEKGEIEVLTMGELASRVLGEMK